MHVLAIALADRACNLPDAIAIVTVNPSGAVAVGTVPEIRNVHIAVDGFAVAVGIYLVGGVPIFLPGFLYLAASAADAAGFVSGAAALGAGDLSAAVASPAALHMVGTGHLEGFPVVHELLRGEQGIVPDIHVRRPVKLTRSCFSFTERESNWDWRCTE